MSINRQWMLAALVGALAAGAQAEIVLSEKVKVDGFLDMSAVHIEGEDDNTDTLSFDQWEVDIHLAPMDGVAARIDIDDQPAAQEGAEIEQAFITLDLGKGFSAKAGKFLSVLGYEGAEPTLLYQYSVSATIIGYPGYSSGVGLKYDFSGGSLYVAGVDGSYSGDGDAGSVSGLRRPVKVGVLHSLAERHDGHQRNVAGKDVLLFTFDEINKAGRRQGQEDRAGHR
jgi:hypothetical protein